MLVTVAQDGVLLCGANSQVRPGPPSTSVARINWYIVVNWTCLFEARSSVYDRVL